MLQQFKRRMSEAQFSIFFREHTTSQTLSNSNFNKKIIQQCSIITEPFVIPANDILSFDRREEHGEKRRVQ